MANVTKIRKFRAALTTFQTNGGRVMGCPGRVIRHIGPEAEVRELSVASLGHPRYVAIGCGPNKLGSYTLDLRVVG